MWLPQALIADVGAVAKVFYVSGEAVRSWNERRALGEPRAFSGWYWARGARENGPFRSRSAAFRDAYYALVLKEAAPPLRLGRAVIKVRNEQPKLRLVRDERRSAA